MESWAESYLFIDTIWVNETRWISFRDEGRGIITGPLRSSNASDYRNEKELIKGLGQVDHETEEVHGVQKPGEISDGMGVV